MTSGPRQLATEEELYRAAVAALARRAYSAFEMRKNLERRAAERALVPNILARLRVEGLIDDARYAALFVRARSANRRQGPRRIARELRSRGVADRHIEAALRNAFSPKEEREALRRRIEIWLRRHGIASPNGLDARRFASLYRSLLRAGFAGDRIRAELGGSGGNPQGRLEIDDEEG